MPASTTSSLFRRIVPKATMEDVILPPKQKSRLTEVEIQEARRSGVKRKRGSEPKTGRMFGVTALFLGQSGAGKTLAAEALANKFKLDLYRIDLGKVVSEEMSETEKNLSRIFDSAEGSGAILFFDEADALFGKRTEVKDSHDRYANIEINYALRRMKSYNGPIILATSAKKEFLYPVLVRRVRSIIDF